MTDEPENHEEELLLTDEVQDEGEAAPPPVAANDAEPEEFAIEIEGEEPEAEETPLIKQLREQIRDVQRENAEFRKAVAPAKIEVGKKPDLWEDCEGDPEKFEAELLAWQDRKDKAARQEREAEQAAEVKNREYQRRFADYRAKAAQLPVKDYDEAEKAVIGALPEVLQSAIVAYAENPAKVVYALAKHPAKLNALAQEADPIKFVLSMRDLERSLKVVNRKQPPPPEAETVQSGSAQIQRTDKEAEKLLSEAMRTGDMTKYNRYMKQRRAA